MKYWIVFALWFLLTGNLFAQPIQLISSCPLPTSLVEPFAFDGRYICLNLLDWQLHIFDASDIYNVSEQSVVATRGRTCLQGNYLYVAHTGGTNPAGLYVYDISDPEHPLLIGFNDEASLPVDLAIRNQHLFLLDQNYGLRVFDICDPSQPCQVGYWHMHEGYSIEMTVVANHVYIIGNGLKILNIENPLAPWLEGEYPGSDNWWYVAVAEGYAYVGVWSSGLVIIDVSNPAQPTWAGGFWPENSCVVDVEIQGNYLYYSDATFPVGRGLYLFDISNPPSLTQVGYYDEPGWLAVSEPYCFLGMYYGNELQVLDCSGATGWQPPLVELTLRVAQPLVVTPGSEFCFDIELTSHLTEPRLIDVWTEAEHSSGELYNPLWRFTNIPIPPGLQFSAEQVRQRVPRSAPLGLYTFRMKLGDYPDTVVGEDEYYISVEPGSSVADNTSSWSYPDIPWPQTETAFSDAGLQPTIQHISPNPFNCRAVVQVNLPSASDLTVTVFNVMGQQVAELANGRYVAGEHTLTFDASNLASGLYFVRATVPGQLNATQKVMLVR